MKMLLVAGGCGLVLMAGAFGEVAGGEGKRFDPAAVPAQLGAFYKQSRAVPPWRDAVKELASRDREVAGQAGAYLVALAKQSLADELSGKAPWHPTPYWGSSGENPAREMRRGIVRGVEDLEDKGPEAGSDAAVDVLEWFIRHEEVVTFRDQAMSKLGNYRSEKADALMRSLATDEGLNHRLSAAALTQVAARGLEIPEPVLRRALADHHGDLRDAAGALWEKQHGADPPELFDPAVALRSPGVVGMMREFDGIFLDRPGKGAKFVRIEQVAKWEEDGKKKEDLQSCHCWFLRRDGDELRVLTLHGKVREYRLGVDPEGSWYGPMETTLTEIPSAGIVERIAKLRASGDEEHELSEHGGFSGQFEGRTSGVPEALLAYVLHREKEWDLCARILFPALDTHADDSHLVEIVKHRLARVYGYRMLVEFIGNRDYDAALAVAAQIDKHFKQTQFHDEALRLLDELPRRRDDFHGLTLPTPDDWAEWKKRHSRNEQVAYLCRRLRLMNCYQDVQPGDVDFFYAQFAEPSGLDEDGARSLWLGKTPVINPLVEMLGMEAREEDEKDHPGMNLTIRDVPVMAPFLKDDWLILSVGYWRTFHPSRTFTTTRELLEWALYRAAKRELLDPKDWAGLGAEEIDGKIEEMIMWAEERSDRSESELLLESLGDLAKSGERWHEARHAASQLVELGDKRALPLIAGWLDHEDTEAYQLESILPRLRELDAGMAKPLVGKYLEHVDPGVQMEAALNTNMGEQSLRRYVPIVASDGSPAAWKALASLFKGVDIATITGYDNIPLCRQLEEQGFAAGLKHYREMLNNRTSGIPGKVGWGDDTVVAYMFADRLIDGYAPHNESAAAIKRSTKPKTEERLSAVFRWLEARIEKLETQDRASGK